MIQCYMFAGVLSNLLRYRLFKFKRFTLNDQSNQIVDFNRYKYFKFFVIYDIKLRKNAIITNWIVGVLRTFILLLWIKIDIQLV